MTVILLLPLGEAGWLFDAHAKGSMVVVRLSGGELQPGKVLSCEVDPDDLNLARACVSWP